MRLVTVTPAGRRPYLEILATYLLRHRDLIDEHQWWLNTRAPDDIAFIYQLADRFPDFFKVVVSPIDLTLPRGDRIWRFLRECDDQDTVYLRLDDDICYVGEGALKSLRDFRLAHPEPFLVYGNIVNNSVCSYFHQQAGLIPYRWAVLENNVFDKHSWESGYFARKLHTSFIRDVERGNENRWRNVEMPIDGVTRYPINVISWLGSDLHNIPERHTTDIVEEPFLSEELPARLGRPNVVCTDALFGHYAFYPQREYLESTSASLLDNYRRLAERLVIAETRDIRSRTTRVVEDVSWAANNALWESKHGLKRLSKRLRERYRTATRFRRAA